MAINFDGATKLITLTSGTTTLGVRDLWSRWVDWLLTSDNSKFPIAMASVGGDDIDPGAGTSIPIYVFLANGWKIRPQEANHTLSVNDGVLLVSGGGDPFVNTTGSFVVRVNYQQPVQAITVATGGGGGSAPSASDVAAAVWSSSRSSNRSAGSLGQALAEVFELHGLDLSAPLTVTPTSRDAGTISQTVTTVGTTTTVQRDS